jgi:LacI family transcriptional regulator
LTGVAALRLPLPVLRFRDLLRSTQVTAVPERDQAAEVVADTSPDLPRSGMVGVAWDPGYRQQTQHPFLQDVLDGVRRELISRGYDTLLLTPPAEIPGGDPGAYLARARQLRLEGVVLLGVNPRDPAVEALAASSLPCVGVDLDVRGPRSTWITSDNIGGAATAVRHLHATGRRRIATVTGPMQYRPSVERLLGFRRELTRLGLRLPEEYTVEGDFFASGGEGAMRRLLSLRRPPDAVFVAGDLMAVGALHAAAEAGAKVPTDVAIVAFDDVQVAAYTQPRLTTMRQDTGAFGAVAAEQLLALCGLAPDEPGPPPVVLPTRLVVRESCGGVAG